MVIFKAKGLLTHMLPHGVTDTCNTCKYNVFLYGHLSDDGWPSVITTRKCNSVLIVVRIIVKKSGLCTVGNVCECFVN